MSNIIVLKGKGHTDEYVTDEACSPGMDVQLAPDGKIDLSNATSAELAKGIGGLKIVVEDALQGKTVDDAYAVGDVVQVYSPVPGDIVNLLIADGETIAFADNIVRETLTGLFIEAAGTETNYVAEALEALSPSGSNGLVACRIVRV